MTIKDLKYVKTYSVNPLSLILNNMNDYFEKMNKYLTLVPTNESQEKNMDYCGLK